MGVDEKGGGAKVGRETVHTKKGQTFRGVLALMTIENKKSVVAPNHIKGQ